MPTLIFRRTSESLIFKTFLEAVPPRNKPIYISISKNLKPDQISTTVAFGPYNPIIIIGMVAFLFMISAFPPHPRRPQYPPPPTRPPGPVFLRMLVDRGRFLQGGGGEALRAPKSKHAGKALKYSPESLKVVGQTPPKTHQK